MHRQGTSIPSEAFVLMKCVGNAGNQELVEALRLQGELIGNLELEKAQMLAQFNLLSQELAQRAQLGTLAAPLGTAAAACASGVGTAGGTDGGGADDRREPTEVGNTGDVSSREPFSADRGGGESGDCSRGSGNRTRSRDQRASSAPKERTGTTTSRPREPSVTNKIGTRASSPRRSLGNAGNLQVASSQYVDVRVTRGELAEDREGSAPTQATATGNVEGPMPPQATVRPCSAPIDLRGREPNASTVFVGNIDRSASELEILELFNSVGGFYGNREPNIVVAVNFVYYNGNFQGQAYLLYSTVALADFVVQRMHDRELRRRKLYVIISDCRFNTANLGRRGNSVGTSRGGARIWECNEVNPRD